MNDSNNASNPKLIVAVQMLCIGIVLLVLGAAVVARSPIGRMPPAFRFWSIASNGSIILTGLAFAVGGFLRLRKAKRGSG